ncbi:MAG: double-strand break repair helicase AddA [Robiginitomaculum sp.]
MSLPSKEYLEAVDMQGKAAAPNLSVFVSANAGSGKTRVLVDRVSRILLDGTKPDKILCLTYTKAAASEMQARLFKKLGDWSILSSEELAQTLNALEDVSRVRTDAELGKARLLFARALETPGGLKVQTIHAFCEQLLKRFPLEAGLAPGTDAIDDQDALTLKSHVITKIEKATTGNPKGEITTSIALLATHKNDKTLDALFTWAMNNSYDVDAWVDAGGPNILSSTFGLDANDTQESVLDNFWQESDKERIKTAAQGMLGTGSKNNTRGIFALGALTEKNPKVAFNLYMQAFCSGSGAGTLFKPVVFKSASDLAKSFFGGDKENPSVEARRLLLARDKVRALHVIELTQAFYTLAVLATKEYRALKQTRRLMDFDDQIYLARRLLTRSEAREWVRYKLDGGVDHILVDEAQDTSKTQWDIIDALSDEFFQPSPDSDPRRRKTLFAVGDEKQSIYSFQGAQPEQFLQKIQDLTKREFTAKDVKMSMSFRSAGQVLSLVDHIFYKNEVIKEMFDTQTYAPASDAGFHTAHRGDSGLIEFWPAVPTAKKEKLDNVWKPEPVDAPNQQDARERLARQIALQIKDWLRKGTLVYDRELKHTRPMHAGDIMILVKKRLAFFDAVIRNLKDAGVPVAGADQLSLKQSIAVQDLLSLAKFTLLPADDLSLAEVLKSPLFGWSEEALFEIAHNRAGSLWAALPKGEDKTVLGQIKSMAAKYAPYEFFARTLALVAKPSGPSLYQKMLTRMGVEIVDALDAFLASALAHQRNNAPSLLKFITNTLSDDHKVKREMSGDDMVGQSEVRVMTVHAAKGLEAPVVILPDTTQIPSVSKQDIFKHENGFVINVPKDEQPKSLEDIIAARQADQEREALRLLYVALTRAESRLLICGFESNHKVAENSWHERVQHALEGMSASVIETEFGDGLRYGKDPKEAPRVNSKHLKINEEDSLPSWARTNPIKNTQAIKHYSPSRLMSETKAPSLVPPVRSPLNILGGDRHGFSQFRRGNLIHKLLQILPDIGENARQNSGAIYLKGQGLSNKESKAILAEVFAVLNHNDFAFLFSSGSQAEISLIGGASALPNHIVLNGQIDRLVFHKEEVWIIDYKSNRPLPKTIDDVAQIYIRQMAAYRALVQDLYPDKTVKTALLWTDEPVLMALPDALLDTIDWNTAFGA